MYVHTDPSNSNLPPKESATSNAEDVRSDPAAGTSPDRESESEGEAPQEEDEAGNSISREESVSSLCDDDWVNLSSSSHPLVTSTD